jgi:CRISPR/Cas system-associated exonuclease Cas4 (RecB family)
MKNADSLQTLGTLSAADVFDVEEAYVECVSNKPRDNRQGVFHPSAVGGCARRNVYEYIRTPCIDTIDADSLEIFDIGHAVHDLVQGKLVEMCQYLEEKKGLKASFEAEVPCPPDDPLLIDFGIAGTCDGVLVVSDPGVWTQRMVVEIKSSKDKNFHRLNKPKKDHIEQAHLYAFRFDCPIILIWYYNKDNSQRRVFVETFDQKVLDRVLKRFQAQLRHAEQGTLPERDENWFMCPRCEYRDVCKPPILKQIRGKRRKKKISQARKRGGLRGKKLK